ncbi:acetyl-CoA C-acetyltransferase [Paracoccus aestuarii]|uniref:Acetyl-CoA C-acetyltransferase n=1 Tax=Paracoccus aestuarii TaxID=453842 RepID=A0A418ZYF2_9RHOB|nr:acetyl-CoA C-acetyltransferase [Paracoccus aestuarii]RJL05522.1 acetyl-CoA C-acetyltransferase [Paracoccus aestuarii]WCQ98611.1 acetyl-CoA C-acetyltransferase [Paracoccus aestuarii]
MTSVQIFDAVRTPRGRGKASVGALAELSPTELAAIPLRALQQRSGLDTAAIGDVVLGCVDPVGGQGGDIARTAALVAGYDQGVPGVQINRFCASGLEACAIAAGKVASGEAGLVVAGGVEMMSRIPMLSSGMPVLADPAIAIAQKSIPQGVAADLIATLRGYSRHDVDMLAVTSQTRAARAWAEGRFARGIVPVTDRNGLLVLDRDEAIRPDADLASIATLKPSFASFAAQMGYDAVAAQKYPGLDAMNYVHHAGNSSQIVDGAAALLLGSREAGAAQGLLPRARIRGLASVGSEPTIMLTGPKAACERALKQAGLGFGDIDLWELNEAFAAVVLYFLEQTGLDAARVNVNGGAIAMGHPLGATGAMILGTLLDELERADRQFGCATLCAATGQAIAMVIERLDGGRK